MYAAPLTSPQIYPVNSRQLLAAENTLPTIADSYAKGFGVGSGQGVEGLAGCGGGGGCNSGSKCGCGCSGLGEFSIAEDLGPYTSLLVHGAMVVFAVAGFKMLFGGRRAEKRAAARRRKRK